MRIAIDGWLRVLFEESPMAIGISRDGVTLDVNNAFVALFGYASIDELRGQSILEHIAPSHREHIRDTVARRARGESLPLRYETRGLRKDGTEFPIDVATKRVVVPDGPLTFAFMSDRTERENTLQALRASEERFRTLAGAALEGVFILVEDRIVLANEAGAALYGYEPATMIGASMMDLVAPEDREGVVEHQRRGATRPYEGVGLRRDGTTFFVEARGRSLLHQGRPARVSIIRDITERKRAEVEQQALAERVRQAQKLESLGVLAGGVAHDFNNILTVIMNATKLAQRSNDLGPTAAEHLDVISGVAARAAELCRQMLAYAGKGSLTRAAVDLSEVVDEIANMLDVSVGKKATLVRELSANLPLVLADATQIRQIVMNLVLNAAEAITGPHGTVAVSTGVETIAKEDLARSPAGGDPKPGVHVYIEVRDDGVGMESATIAKMFDPFFTTKFVGRGLGMAAVLGIVRGHAGAIDVASKLGTGTRIRVSFPASSDVEAERRSALPHSDLHGEGLVLLVDDEENVRRSTRLLIESFGFEVLVARDGVEAVEVFRASWSAIRVVLLDLTMPKMDGLETLVQLRQIAPAVPVVLTSGYGPRPGNDALDGSAKPDAVLGKPYSAEALLATLHDVMNGTRSGDGPLLGTRAPPRES